MTIAMDFRPSLWLLVAAVLWSATTAQQCDSPTSLVTTADSSQFSASSTKTTLQPSYVAYGTGTDKVLGGWCPSTAQAGEWLDVSFESAINVTSVILQHPFSVSPPVPKVTEIKVLYEDANAPFGQQLSTYLDKNGSEVLNVTYSGANEDFELVLDVEIVALRVRIEVVSFDTEPCFRLDIKGCPVDQPPPEIEAPQVSLDYVSISDMRLVCDIQDPYVFGVQYWVTWYRDNLNISTELLENGDLKSVLNVTENDFSSQQLHKCSAKACYVAGCSDGGSDGFYTNGVDSNEYKPEIQILNQGDITLGNGETKTIQVRSTAPSALLCVFGGKVDTCRVKITAVATDAEPLKCCKNPIFLPKLLFPESKEEVQHDASQCSVQMPSIGWKNTLAIAVTTNSGAYLFGNHISTVVLSLALDGDLYQAGEKSIGVNATLTGDSPVCQYLSSTDVRTFDGSYYNAHLKGEFILYKHTSLPLEVRAFSQYCPGTSVSDDVRCTCAVAVRVDGDVILLKGCDPEEAIISQMFNWGDPSTVIVRRYHGGDRYEVILPSGGFVTVQKTYRGSLNVWFYPGTTDFNSTQGLCGLYDGDAPNDIPQDPTIIDDLARSWRVAPEDSYYNGWCPNDLEGGPSLPLQQFSRCQSLDSAGVVSVVDNFVSCFMLTDFDPADDMTAFLRSTQKLPGNCVEQDTIQDVFNYTMGGDITQLNLNFPAGWDQSRAEEACQSAINQSVAAQECNISLFSDQELQNCVSNIKETGDEGWLHSYVQLFVENCITQYGEKGPPLPTMAVLCHNDCSGNGTCFKEECTCDAGLAGSDCSVNASVAPIISGLEQPVCNSLTDSCTTIVVLGTSFIAQDICYYQRIEVNDTAYQIASEVMEASDTFYVSSSQMRCTLPDAGNYLVSVGLRTDLRSNDVMFLTTDKACFECDITAGTCMRRALTCYINNACYHDLQQNPSNFTQICNSTSNIENWSDRTDFCPGSGSQWLNDIPADHALTFHNEAEMYNVSDVDTCRSLCLINFKLPCKSADYDSNENVCYMSKYTGKSTDGYLLPVNGFTHSEWVCINDRCQGFGAELRTQSNVVSTSILEVFTQVWTLNLCRSLCEASADCGGINFLSLRGICALGRLNASDSVQAAPGWVFEEFNCLNGSNTQGPQYEVSQASIIATFEGPGQDTFLCQFEEIADVGVDLSYNVLWAVDEVWISESSVDNSTLLPRNYSDLTNGMMLRCAVSVCESSKCEDSRGPMTLSDIYSATLKISNAKDLSINEGESGEAITVMATAPPYVLCRGKVNAGLDTDNCQIDVRFPYEETSSASLCPNGDAVTQTSIYLTKDMSEAPACQLSFTNDDWQATYRVQVKANIDSLYDGTHTISQNISVEFQTNNVVHIAETFAELTHTIVDRDTSSLCMSLNDPHVTTFDGRLFHNFFEGEFILYRHKTMPYEVRAFYRSCNGIASCNCAVAVRAGDDVVIVDKCGPEAGSTDFYPMTIKMIRRGILTPGFKVMSKYEGREYRIVLPNGMMVYVGRSVIKGYNYVNIWIKPSPVDMEMTEGLCGFYDTDESNDLTYPNGTISSTQSDQPLDYSLAWRVDPEDTYYTGACDNDHQDGDQEKQASYCYCQAEGVELCEDGNDIVACPYLSTNSYAEDLSNMVVVDAERMPLMCKIKKDSYAEDLSNMVVVDAERMPLMCQ